MHRLSALTRVFLLLSLATWLIGSGITPAGTQSQDQLDIKALTTEDLNVRTGPGVGYPVITTLPSSSVVLVEGRNNANTWALAHTYNGDTHGWVAAHYLILEAGASLRDLPVARARPNPNPDAPTGDNAPAEPPTTDPRIARLLAAPVLPTISPRVREILLEGQRRGRRAGVFAKVGDCQTENPNYLSPLSTGDYDLGPYAHLQETIDYFMTPPSPGAPDPFARVSMATAGGLTVGTLFDPAWADPKHCQPGETPLACEYRLTQPSVAIIMLGGVDKKFYRTPWFEQRMREAVEFTIEQGIVPVLVTYPGSPDFLWEPLLNFNTALLNIAQDESTPLINLWLASRSLPNHGLSTDNFHLSYKGERTSDFDINPYIISFGGDEQVWGQTLHNLLTLQTLELIRHETQNAPGTPTPLDLFMP